VLQFSYLRRILEQRQTDTLERELIAACRCPLGSLGLRAGLRSALHSDLDAAEGLFLASLISTVIWSLLIFTIACW